MKSIQSKIILLIIMGIMVSTIVIGGVGIYTFRGAMHEDCIEIMNLACSQKAQELNTVLGSIEQSVETLSIYAIENLESVDELSSNLNYLENYTQNLDEIGLAIANKTDGAVAIYVRFNPEITSNKAGFFRVRDSEEEEFRSHEVTDFSEYAEDDDEHVGWYYIPVKAGAPVWMLPYQNKNVNDMVMISYVVPIYKENQLIGVVGMDINVEYIKRMTDDIKIYDTGHAFLVDDEFRVIYGRHYEQGTLVKSFSKSLSQVEISDITNQNKIYDHTFQDEKKKITFRALKNGMYLAVTAPISEINATPNKLVVHIIIITTLIVMIFIYVSVLIAKTIIRPLKELNKAAKEIANGNLDFTLVCKSKDEVGTLAESVKETAKQLKVRMDYINNLAYIDKLLGVKNNTAYIQDVALLKEEMKNKQIAFSIFVIDVNGLKNINDTYGHDIGNAFILETSKAIVKIFEFENVYRIGGDEFTVIVRNADSQKCIKLEKEFDTMIKNIGGKIKIYAAVGSAVYDRQADKNYDSVFKRADKQMYRRKQQMKENGEVSRVEEG